MKYSFTSKNDPLVAAASAVLSEGIVDFKGATREEIQAIIKKLYDDGHHPEWEDTTRLSTKNPTTQAALKKALKNFMKKEDAELDEAYDINSETRKIELALATLRESFKGQSPFYKELVKKDKANEKLLLAMLKHIRDTESLMDDIVFADLKKGKFD